MAKESADPKATRREHGRTLGTITTKKRGTRTVTQGMMDQAMKYPSGHPQYKLTPASERHGPLSKKKKKVGKSMKEGGVVRKGKAKPTNYAKGAKTKRKNSKGSTR